MIRIKFSSYFLLVLFQLTITFLFRISSVRHNWLYIGRSSLHRKKNKSMQSEDAVKVSLYIYIKILLVNFLYCRLILVLMVKNMNKQMVTFSNTAAERFKQYLSRRTICVNFFFNKLRSIFLHSQITNSWICFLFNGQLSFDYKNKNLIKKNPFSWLVQFYSMENINSQLLYCIYELSFPILFRCTCTCI